MIILILWVIGTCIYLSPLIFEWHRNNAQPKTYFDAKVIKKRKDSLISNTGVIRLTRQSYFTFEILSNGEKKECICPENDYDRFIEGDVGILCMQGTRYIDFEKTL